MKINLKYKILVLGFIYIGLLFTGMAAFAQDPQFSQYYASPLYLNPGFTGTTDMQRVAANSRFQWTQLKSPFVTHSVSYDVAVPSLNSGFGVIALTDKAGSANLRTTTIGALYSSKIQLSKEWMVSPGLNFSYGSRGIDFDKLLFGDQIEFNGPTIDDAVAQLNNRNYFDFSSGVVIYNQTLWMGFSAHHINQPNHSLLGEDAKLPMKMSVHGGINIPLKLHPLAAMKLSSISPSFVYFRQGEFQQLDLGVNMVYDPILVGLWYRGVPLQKNYNSKANQDAIIVMLGLNLKYLEVGYSYDLSISEIAGNSGGSHEISIVYRFEGLNPHKVKRKDKFLPCPNYPHFKNYN